MLMYTLGRYEPVLSPSLLLLLYCMEGIVR